MKTKTILLGLATLFCGAQLSFAQTVLVSNDFKTDFGIFTAKVVKAPATWTAATPFGFAVDAKYGAKVTAYNSTDKLQNDAEAWLTSSAINLSQYTGGTATIEFSEAINYVSDEAQMKGNHTLWISSDNTNWSQLTIPTMPTLTSAWTFVPSTAIAIPSQYLGLSSVYIGFKYLGSTVKTSTWEITDLKITATSKVSAAINDYSFDSATITTQNQQINISGLQNQSVAIYNITGQLVQSFTSTGDDTVTLSSGLYIVKVGKQTTKVVL